MATGCGWWDERGAKGDGRQDVGQGRRGQVQGRRRRGSHLRGPLRGVLHHGLAEAVIHVGRHLPPPAGPGPGPGPGPLRTLAGLLPAQRSRRLRPARSARRPGPIGQTRGGAGPAAGGSAGPCVPERGTGAKGAGCALPRTPRPRSVPAARSPGTPPPPPPPLPRRSACEASRRARLPPGPGSARLPGSSRGTLAAPPGPAGPSYF